MSQMFQVSNDEPVAQLPVERDYVFQFNDGGEPVHSHGYLMVNSTMTMVGTGPLSQGRIVLSVPNAQLKFVSEVAPLSKLNG